MKPINEMTLAECLDLLCEKYIPIVMEDGKVYYRFFLHRDRIEIIDRIRELTRWIPVVERLPTIEDVGQKSFRVWLNGIDTHAFLAHGKIHIWVSDAYNEGWLEYDKDDSVTAFTHWQIITKPEGG